MMSNVTDTMESTTSTDNPTSQLLWSTTVNTTSTSIDLLYSSVSSTKLTTQDHRDLVTKTSFIHHLKDETVYVAVIVMGLIVPSIFIFVIVMICLKRRREQNTRRNQMLLRNQQDVAMHELPYGMRSHLAAGNFA